MPQNGSAHETPSSPALWVTRTASCSTFFSSFYFLFVNPPLPPQGLLEVEKLDNAQPKTVCEKIVQAACLERVAFGSTKVCLL